MDKELHALAAILHDMGWDTTGQFISHDRRFEVDGADAARGFVERQVPEGKGEGEGWGERRKQILWDAIAMHTTPSIANFKEVEVKITGLGILTDLAGRRVVPGVITQEEWEGVVEAFPRTGLKEGLTEIMCGLCRTKPATTYDNFAGDFGEQLVEGYEREGKRVWDMMMGIQN